MAGLWTRRACQRQLDDLARAQADPTWPYEWSDAHACDVCDFIEKLPHVEGTWKTSTIHLEPVQIFLLTTIFGWRRRSDGGRRFSMVYIEAARKFAKSTLTAAVCLYCLTCEGEVGPQIVIGATTAEQAQKIFRPAKRMVERTAALRSAFHVTPWMRSITCELNGGYIQPINAKGSTQDGWNPHMGVLDELHAQRDPALFNVIRSAVGSRANPLIWIITTAGYNISGVCYDQRSLVTKALEGIIVADHYFGAIFSIDESDDPFDETCWVKANPMLGITPTWESMRGYAAEATNSPSSLGEFTTKRLNVWAGAAQAWLNLAQWDSCADPSLRLEDFTGQAVWIGGDLSDCNDITSVVLIFRQGATYYAFPFFYLPEDLVKAAAQTTAAHYAAWAREGHLILTPGNYIDYAQVESDVRAFAKRFIAKAIMFDRYGSAQMIGAMANDGLPAMTLPKNAANWTAPARELEAMVRAGPDRFRHTGHPIYRWNASNAVVTRRVDNSLLTKKEHEHSPNKIDGIDATIEALSQALLFEPKPITRRPLRVWTPDGWRALDDATQSDARPHV